MRELARTVPALMTKSLAINTLKSYNQGFRAWLTWSCMYDDVDTLPIKSVDLAFFFTSVIQQNGRYGKIEQAFYGINWLHDVLGLTNPCESKMVLAIKESAKRILKRPTVKKCPIKPHHLQCIVLKYGDTNSVYDIFGFVRWVLTVRRSLEHQELQSAFQENVFQDLSRIEQNGPGGRR